MAAITPAVPPAPTFGERGFTLTEMAVVLVIVALLIGGMVVPLSAQQDMRNTATTQKQIADAGEALYGYAASRAGVPYLPCPDNNDDGVENREADGTCTVPEGNLPWADLGIGRQDAWGNALRYAVSPAFANDSGFALLSSGSLRICADTCATEVALNVPAVVFSRGKNSVSEQTHPDFFDRTAGAAYDDVTAWLPANILINRMISAGKLP